LSWCASGTAFEETRFYKIGKGMRTQQGRDDTLIWGVHKAISYKKSSIFRATLFAVITVYLGVMQLLLADGWFASFVGYAMITSALLLIIEGARLGLAFGRLNNGWTSFSGILMGLVICFGIFRLFESWSLVPLQRTAFWSLLVWFGFILGVLLSALEAAEKEEN